MQQRPTVYHVLVVWSAIGLVWSGTRSACAAKRPAMLVHAVRGQYNGGVDPGYLEGLHAAGIEVDYTDDHSHFTWARIQRFNCLVIHTCPGEKGTLSRSGVRSAPWRKEFLALVNRYLDAGGGILVMAYINNVDEQTIKPLVDPWNAKIPLEIIEDPDTLATMTRMRVRLCFTDQVSPSPVSAGVKQVWFPYGQHYNSNNTDPLILGPEWQVVVRASKTARTVPLDRAKSNFPAPPDVVCRKQGETSPPIFGIRSYRKGRLALCSTYPQFSVAQGTQWLYNREVLSEGLQGKPSHFGKLLANTIRWLAEPSLAGTTLGGHRTDLDRLKPLNSRRGIRERFEEAFWGEKELDLHRPPRGRIYKGLIGVKTAYGGAKGTPADYASVAREVGLDYIAVMDDFAKLTPAKFDELKRECKRLSDSKLLVLAGFAIDNNIGNHLFIFGPDVPWPSDRCLTGPNKSLLNQQYQDGQGKFQRMCVVLDWLLGKALRHGNQIGFYNFTESAAAGGGRGMAMKDLKTYGMAATHFYRNGKLVEDRTDDYLLTAQGSVPPSPGAVNIVRSPAELRREVLAQRGLTYGQARSIKTLFKDALFYPHQYAAPNVFPSSGPMILAWPQCYRVHTFAKEDFVTGKNVMISPIHVTSDVGLKEVRVYNGRDLYRRFLAGGARQLGRTLVLDGTVHKNLVLVADDVRGGRAVSFARISRKVGDTFEYCGDRVNDCGDMLLAHGPTMMRVLLTPKVFGGATWDGGPKGHQPLANLQGSQPVVIAHEGREGDRRFNPTPLLEFTDEGARVVRTERDDVIRADVPCVNAWHTSGPIVPSTLFTHTQQFAQWHPATHQVHPYGHAGYGLPYGAIPTVFTTWLRFRRDLDVKQIKLLYGWHYAKTFEPRAAIRTRGKTTRLDLDTLKGVKSFVLQPGDWVGLYSGRATNSHIVTVRGIPMRLQIGGPRTHPWISFWTHPAKRSVKAGDTMQYGLATTTFPVDADLGSVEDLKRRVDYLNAPTGMEVTGGKRLDSPGVLDFRADAHTLEVKLPKPDWQTYVTLPVRVQGMNRRWSAGVWLKRGFVQGHYGPGVNRYRPLGVDLDGCVYVPISPDLAPMHHVVAGHPIVADPAGKDLFIQVTQISGGTLSKGKPTRFRWHVSVNNPLDRPVTTTLRQTMRLPGMRLSTQKLTLEPGGYRVVQK